MIIEKIQNMKVVQNMPYRFENLDLVMPISETLISGKNSSKDTVSISVEAKDLLAKDESLVNMNERLEEFKEMMKQLRESSNGKKPYIDRIKCLQIAMRIMNGDKVPNKDMFFLAENEPAMYANALLLRKQNDKPKEYDSILEDEKDNATTDLSSPASFEGSSESSSGGSISTDAIEVSSESE